MADDNAMKSLSELGLTAAAGFSVVDEDLFGAAAEPTIDVQDLEAFFGGRGRAAETDWPPPPPPAIDAGNEGWKVVNEDDDADALLSSFLTGGGGDDDSFLAFPDSQIDSAAEATTTGSSIASSGDNFDLVDLFGGTGNDDDENNLLRQSVNPRTNSPDCSDFPPQKQHDDVDSDEGGVGVVRVQVKRMPPPTFSVLPRRPSPPVNVVIGRQQQLRPPPAVMTNNNSRMLLPHHHQHVPTVIRVNATTTSGFDSKKTSSSKWKPKPRLHLTPEEKRLCDKEGVVLPSCYPLKKEEERNLKRIRRKIRNKLSAQDSRKRKREYVDSMEAKATKCAAENADLVKRLSALETQNKTLVGQLRRLRRIIVNRGGVGGGVVGSSNVVGKGQAASTALMFLLFSTALFLIPGMKEQFESKSSLDIFQAVKCPPPMPVQSRSLLHFVPQIIKEEYPPASNSSNNNNRMESSVVVDDDASENNKNNFNLMSAFGDHDYVMMATDKRASSSKGRKRAAAAPTTTPAFPRRQPPAAEKIKKSYIVADVPPLGYGDHNFAMMDGGGGGRKRQLMDDDDDDGERHLSVNVTGGRRGVRTVVLHVPKNIK